MAYKKLYNPSNTEIALFYGGVEVKVPPRGIFIGEEEIANGVSAMSARLELTPATDDDYKAFVTPPKSAKPAKLGGKKGGKKK